MQIKNFDELEPITANDGKVLLNENGIIGRSTIKLSDIIDDALDGKADADSVYTKTEINEMIADFGGFTIATDTGEDNHPDIDEPDTKTIYLVKSGTGSRKKDKYCEWIWAIEEGSTEPTWVLIGETSFELNLSAGTDLKYEDGRMSVNTNGTVANSADMSFVAGSGTYASGIGAAAFGINTSAIAFRGAFAEGEKTYAEYDCHAEGWGTSALGDDSHTEGFITIANGEKAHAEGQATSANGAMSHAEGSHTITTGECAHAEGYETYAGYHSHAEGELASADGPASHAEGYKTYASYHGHAEGQNTSAMGSQSHTEGDETLANNSNSYAEGYKTSADSYCSHTEGGYTLVFDSYGHAEGYKTSAGVEGHSEGFCSIASGAASHAGGEYTCAKYQDETVIGKYNRIDPQEWTASNAAKPLFVIGNGTGTGSRSDAFYVNNKGGVSAASSISANSNYYVNGQKQPTITLTGSVPANTTAAQIYVDANGNLYAVTGNI